MMDDMFEVGYGQATSDGDMDDVDMFGPDGTIGNNVASALGGAYFMVIAALVALWVLGAFVFKGANHS